METITLTFGDAGENHAGMKLVGKAGEIGTGFSQNDLLAAKERFEQNGYECELIDLQSLCPFPLLMYELKNKKAPEKAYLLVVRRGVNYFTNPEEILQEMKQFEWDTKYWDTRRSKVLNKHARSNVCFGEDTIMPNYEEKQGTVISYKDVPNLESIRKGLASVLGEKGKNLICEGNRYFNIKKCGIGWHGDSERKKVVGVRLGATMSFKIRWYYKYKPVGECKTFEFNDGDLYMMSEKAVGYDWKRSSIFTLRHSAGCAKYTS